MTQSLGELKILKETKITVGLLDKDASRHERERVENMHPLRFTTEETIQINMRSIVEMDYEP